MTTNWRAYGSETVAAALDKSDLPGFWRQVTVGPDEAALIIRNGRIEETVTQERVGTSGFGDRFVGLFGRSADVQVVFVSTAPFDLTFYVGKATRSEDGLIDRAGDSSKHVSSFDSRGAESRRHVHDTLERRGQADSDVANVVIRALTADGQIISAQVGLTLSLAIDDAELLSGLLRGKKALGVWDIAALVRDELLSKALVPEIGRITAGEVRGNRGLLERMSHSTEQALRPTFDMWGLTLENFVINWGMTEQEEEEIEQARTRREEQATDFAHRRSIRDMERDLEIQRTRIQNLQEVKVLEAQGEWDLQEMYLADEISRDNLLDEKRISGTKVDAQIRVIELDVERQEANLKLEFRRQEDELALERDRRRQQMQIDIEERKSQTRIRELESESKARANDLKTESEIDMYEMGELVRLQNLRKEQNHLQTLQARGIELDHEFARRKQELDSQSIARQSDLDATTARLNVTRDMISKALDSGVVTPDVLITMLEQSTEQEYSQTSDAKVEAREAAKGAGNAIDELRTEQDRERTHQAEMARLASDMMQASKQGPGAPAPNNNRPSQTNANAPQVDGISSSVGATCPSCSSVVQPEWKACPFCATSLSAFATCANCGNDVQAGWKACPSCGNLLDGVI